MIIDAAKMSPEACAGWTVIDGMSGLRYQSAVSLANDADGTVMLCACGEPGKFQACLSEIMAGIADMVSPGESFLDRFNSTRTVKVPKVKIDITRKTILVNMKDDIDLGSTDESESRDKPIRTKQPEEIK